MSERIVLDPVGHLIETIASHLEKRGKDFSASAIVFPGKRPAHFLRKELALRAGGSIIPPKIFSVDEFVLSLYQHLHPEHIFDLDPIDAVALLHLVHSELKERLGGDYFASLDTFIPIGLKLFGELEELRLAHLPERMLKEVLSAFTYNRLFSLAEYYTKFYARTAEKGFTTRAVRYADVAEHISELDLSGYAQIIVAGLFKLTHAEKIIFDDLEKRSNTLFVFQTDKIEEGTPEPEIHFYKASDTHGQVFALSALIKKQLDKNQPIDEHSVIVLPTADALFPVVHQTLSLMPQEQYNIALEYPMARTLIYGFLNNLMELVSTKQGERYSAAQYIKFILHPYTKNIRLDQRTDVTRMLFHAIESMLTKDKSKIFLTLEEIEQSDEIFTNVAFAISESDNKVTPEQLKKHLHTIHGYTIHALEDISSIKEFAHNVITILTYIYEQSTARLHPLFRPYAEALLKVLLHLEQSFVGSASFLDSSSYFNFLKHYVSLQDVPFPGTPLRGLQVLGLLETRSLQFDDVYFLNANDTMLPGGIGTDMLLPQQLREKLGLETRRERDTLSEYYFHLLIRGAKRVHLFYSDSGESDKSRFVEQLLWERQKRDGIHLSDSYIQTVRYQVKLANGTVRSIPKSDVVLAVMDGFTYSASAFDTYLQCPIQFYYRYIMRLQEKEDATEDIDSQEIGKFVHEVLYKFYEPLLGKKIETRDLLSGRMKQLVDELFVQNFGAESAGATYLLKRQIQRQMEALLKEYQQPMMEAGEIIIKGLEEKISIHTLGAKFEGRLDRIEQRGDKIFILDYKTGPKPGKPPINFSKLDLNIHDRKNWSEAITSLQLPMYLLLYSMHTKIAVEQIVPAYLYLGRNRLSKECEVVFVEETEERVACFEQVKRLIELLLKEINDAAIPFSPPADLSKTCPRCPYTRLCGTAWVQG
jgi:CRISPR/Cas system-associated exonuclease Cas4 (RecB family)